MVFLWYIKTCLMGTDQLLYQAIDIAGKTGLWGVSTAMALESMGIPFVGLTAQISSGHYINEGKFTIGQAVFFMTIGNIIGSTISYYIGYFFGDAIRKVRKKKELFKLESKIDEWLERHGKTTFFMFQLYGTTRSFCSFPAGLLKYKFRDFITATFFGGLLFTIAVVIFSSNFENFYKESLYPVLGISFGSAIILFSLVFLAVNLSVTKIKNGNGRK